VTRALIALSVLALAAPSGAASAARIRLTAGPSPAQSRAITEFHFRATRPGGRPVGRARISFAGHHARTGARGRATIRLRLDTGRYRARACKRGLLCGTATIEVIPHGP
jgi:hypothetical protein